MYKNVEIKIINYGLNRYTSTIFLNRICIFNTIFISLSHNTSNSPENFRTLYIFILQMIHYVFATPVYVGVKYATMLITFKCIRTVHENSDLTFVTIEQCNVLFFLHPFNKHNNIVN